MVAKKKFKKNQYNEEFVGIGDLLNSWWAQRNLIIKISSIFVVIGLILAFTSKIEYKASSKLMPTSESELGNNFGALSGLAGLAGISLDLNSANVMSPEVYPEIVKSVPFILEILRTPIYFNEIDSVLKTSDYFDQYYTPSPLSILIMYTVGLPSTIRKGLPNSRSKGFPAEYDLIQLTYKEFELVENMQDRISIRVDSNTGMITVTVEMPDAFASAILANKVVSHLTDQISVYKTEKAKVNLEFIEERHKESKAEFKLKQENLAVFTDNNVNLSSALSQAEFQRLQSEYEIAFEVYKGLAIQLEQAKIKVKEDTPIFTIVDPVEVPVDKSKPKRMLMLSIAGLMGLFSSIVFIRLKEVLSKPSL